MKLSIPLLAFLTLVSLEISGQSADSSRYRSLDPYDFHITYLKDDKAILIDVRESFEFRKKRIKDAVNIPSSGNIELIADTLDKGLSLFLYCTTDYRSKRVAAKFSEKGFARVFNLEGGIKMWKEEGFPIEKKRVKR